MPQRKKVNVPAFGHFKCFSQLSICSNIIICTNCHDINSVYTEQSYNLLKVLNWNYGSNKTLTNIKTESMWKKLLALATVHSRNSEVIFMEDKTTLKMDIWVFAVWHWNCYKYWLRTFLQTVDYQSLDTQSSLFCLLVL